MKGLVREVELHQSKATGKNGRKDGTATAQIAVHPKAGVGAREREAKIRKRKGGDNS